MIDLKKNLVLLLTGWIISLFLFW